jgi:acyl-coenzyme A synthetase/AMP-(fatty) acid ligase
VFVEHPGIAEVAVVGLPDDYYCEVIGAVVRVRQGHAATPDAWRSWLES